MSLELSSAPSFTVSNFYINKSLVQFVPRCHGMTRGVFRNELSAFLAKAMEGVATSKGKEARKRLLNNLKGLPFYEHLLTLNIDFLDEVGFGVDPESETVASKWSNLLLSTASEAGVLDLLTEYTKRFSILLGSTVGVKAFKARRKTANPEDVTAASKELWSA